MSIMGLRFDNLLFFLGFSCGDLKFFFSIKFGVDIKLKLWSDNTVAFHINIYVLKNHYCD